MQSAAEFAASVEVPAGSQPITKYMLLRAVRDGRAGKPPRKRGPARDIPDELVNAVAGYAMLKQQVAGDEQKPRMLMGVAVAAVKGTHLESKLATPCQRRHFLRCTETAEWRIRDERIHTRLAAGFIPQHGLPHRSQDRCRMNGIATDREPLLRAIKRNRLAMVAHRRLGRGIGGRTRYADHAGARRYIDDGPRPARPHRTDGITAAQERTVAIHGMNVPPAFQGGMFGIMRRWPMFKTGDPGIVYQDIQLWDVPRKFVPIGLFRHVEPEKLPAKFFGQFLAGRLIDIGNDEVAALAVKRAGDRLANPARGAGDKAGLAYQFLHGKSFVNKPRS